VFRWLAQSSRTESVRLDVEPIYIVYAVMQGISHVYK
jgi:hypothetical protein